MADDSEDPSIVVVPDLPVALDISVDIDTVVAALEDQALDLTAVVLEQRLVVGQMDKVRDFDPMTGTAIVLEMYLPASQIKFVVSKMLNNLFSFISIIIEEAISRTIQHKFYQTCH